MDSYPYRCSACGRRFLLKHAESGQEQGVTKTGSEQGSAIRRPRPKGLSDKKRRAKRALLLEMVLYGLALVAFVIFIRWLSQDRSAPPGP